MLSAGMSLMLCLYSLPQAGQNHCCFFPEPSMEVPIIHWVSFNGMYLQSLLLHEYL